MTDVNFASVGMFLIVLAGTLFITWRAARRTHTTTDFYAASRGITGFQNGLAITGDFVSASTFLGISALIYMNGYDGLLYLIGALVGWPILLFLIAEPLRNLGKYSFADICSYRLGHKRMRSYAALASIIAIMFYLIGQMVGAGKLIQVLFGMPYEYAVVLIGVLMVLYVSFGGMIATTWVQIVKAVLLLVGGTFMVVLIMAQFDFEFSRLFEVAVERSPHGAAILKPGVLLTSPWQTLSLGLALCFGPLGLPHILMRFFTVPDAKEARKSVFWATGFIGYFFLLVFVIGYGAIALIPEGDPAFFAADGQLIGGSNMSAVHVANVVGGGALMGFISAVAFATIVAVVSGLTLSAAATIAHDLYGHVIKNGQASEVKVMRISRIVPFVVGALSIWFGLLFKEQNIAVIVIQALAIAGSSTFPVLLLTIYWQRLTTRGAFWGGMVGLVSAVVLAILGPTVWVDVFQFEQAIFPLEFPSLVAMPLTFVLCWVISILDKEGLAQEHIEAFRSQTIRAQTGIGAETASNH